MYVLKTLQLKSHEGRHRATGILKHLNELRNIWIQKYMFKGSSKVLSRALLFYFILKGRLQENATFMTECWEKMLEVKIKNV